MEQAMKTKAELYQEALQADCAWSLELQRAFGPYAGDVRYTKKGQTGSTLAPLYAEFARTTEVWRQAK